MSSVEALIVAELLRIIRSTVNSPVGTRSIVAFSFLFGVFSTTRRYALIRRPPLALL